MSSALVTGGTGFIGGALCRDLASRGVRVVCLSTRDGDIADPLTLAGAAPADHVFHLAGRTYVPDSWRDPMGFQQVNVFGTISVLEYCRRHGARLTFVSGYLYGIPEQLPIGEGAPVRPNNPYALSKHLAEQVCAFYAANYGVEVTVVRPFNIFGPGQRPHFLVPHIVAQVRAGGTIQVKDLAPRRDYVYVSDLVDALVKTLDGPRGYHVINIGSGTSVSVGELIGAIQAAAGTALPVVSDGEVRPNEIDDVYADVASASTLLGWRPLHTLEQGLRRTLSA